MQLKLSTQIHGLPPEADMQAMLEDTARFLK